ncbi:MAG: hypothetical protein V1794_04295 [Candidatus Glassbacteria bacterium]
MKYSRITIPPGAAQPVSTAAEELAAATGARVTESKFRGSAGEGEIALAQGEAALAAAEVRRLLAGVPAGAEWEAVAVTGGGLVIAGSSARNVCHAALAWIADPARETGRASRYAFKERFSMWDVTLNQWYRGTVAFDRQKHLRELARLGHTGVEVNRYADAGGGWHVRHRKFPGDSYAWYLSYCPALDAFVESSLTEGIYEPEELQRNLADLEEAAAIARSYGMAPGFVCYEPRCVSEKIFDRHPHLRGSRTDHPGRSLEPRYALDIAHPRVLEHYAEMLTRLMSRVPDLRYFVFWTGDSGSGLPFARWLYFGPNGSYLARSKTVERMAAEFSGTLVEAGRKINPEFEVIMELSWEYTQKERERITSALPEGITLSHPLGGSASGILCGTDPEVSRHYFSFDRQCGKEPYGEIVVSSWWDTEPVYGLAFPTIVKQKFDSLRALELDKFFTRGGIYSPSQCPYAINHEVYRELVRGREIADLHAFLMEIATRWCIGSEPQAELLVKAGLLGEEALRQWPVLNWYMAGPCTTQARWITRPLVPDFSRLTADETAAFRRAVFTLESDVARQNLAFEGGIRMYKEEQFERAVKEFDQRMLPQLELTVGVLDQALDLGALDVLVDQRNRYRGWLLLNRTVRNCLAAQRAINLYLLPPRPL